MLYKRPTVLLYIMILHLVTCLYEGRYARGGGYLGCVSAHLYCFDYLTVYCLYIIKIETGIYYTTTYIYAFVLDSLSITNNEKIFFQDFLINSEANASELIRNS